MLKDGGRFVIACVVTAGFSVGSRPPGPPERRGILIPVRESSHMAFQRSLSKACALRALSWWRPIAIAAALVTAIGFAGCSSTLNSVDLSRSNAAAPGVVASESNPNLGTGDFKGGRVLPLSASGNAGTAGQAMRNAAEMALAELGDSNIQLLPKDDGGTGQGAQAAAQQAIDEGAQIVLGPLFAHSVTSAKPVARDHGIPMIAFSTDSNVAATGTYLLSFLPESDVDRVVAYAISQGKRSFIGLVPGSAYGSVVEGEFKQSVARRGGRVMALEHYADGRNKIGDAARLVAQAAGGADALFIPDGGEAVNEMIDRKSTRLNSSHQ